MQPRARDLAFLAAPLAALLSVVPAAQAQTGPDPAPKLRLTFHDGTRLTGELMAVDSTALELVVEPSGTRLRIARSGLASVDRSLGFETSPTRYLGKTTLWMGLACGALLATDFGIHGAGLGFLSGATMGIPVGLVVGIVKRDEVWEPVELQGSSPLRPEARGWDSGATPGLRMHVAVSIPLSR